MDNVGNLRFRQPRSAAIDVQIAPTQPRKLALSNALKKYCARCTCLNFDYCIVRMLYPEYQRQYFN